MKPRRLGFSGLLLIDKPTGCTSHDVVLVARRRLRIPGAGHLGTLDPAASGLLVVALGAATRAIPVWQGGDKTYEGTIRFGIVTATQDLAGEVIETRAWAGLREQAVREAGESMVGESLQVPPMVSAVRIAGERLHRLARRGVMVERAPRTVSVASWEWLRIAPPEAAFRVRCGSGTYVRTLVHDLGLRLGTGAALASLRRTRSEPFSIEAAVPSAMLAEKPAEEVLARGAVPLDQALEVLPAVRLDDRAAATLGKGGRPAVDAPGALLEAGPRSIVFRDSDGRALALGELERREGGAVLACPHVVFPWAVRTGPGRRGGGVPWTALSAVVDA